MPLPFLKFFVSVDEKNGCHTSNNQIALNRHGLARSMSAKGCSPDNAAMEGFFGLLKREFWHGRDWSGWTPARFIEELGGWIGRYNTERRSDALGGRTPAEFRAALGRAA